MADTRRPASNYVLPGTDGRRYYEIIGVPLHLIDLYEHLAYAYRLAVARGTAGGRAQAVEIALLTKDIQAQMDRIGVKTAAEATKFVRERINATRVRPKSLGGYSQSGKLFDSIRSRPLHIVLPRGSGGAGVGDIDTLEAGTTSRHGTRSAYPYYWRAQEDGSTAMVGKTIYGVFQGGEAAPIGPGPNRTHPIFEKRGKGQGKRKKMVVKNPVEAKHFLKDGSNMARAYRRTLTGALEAQAIARMDAIARGGGGRTR